MKVCMFVLNNCEYDTRGLKEAKLIRKVIDAKCLSAYAYPHQQLPAALPE